MEVRRVHALVFSGAGTTMAVARRFCETFAKASEQFGVRPQIAVDDVTPAASTVPVVETNDVLVVALPSYGGRIPAPMAERLGRLNRCQAPVVMLVTYGNRAVDDTFIELADALEAKDLVPVGGASVVAHHSLMTNVAQDRPDEEDLAAVDSLATQVAAKLVDAAQVDDVRLEHIPGSRPYRDFGGVPFKPEADGNLCTGCGACVSQCPVRAIDASDPTATDGEACVSCMRCIEACPHGARKIGGGLALAAARKAFALKCAKKQKSYLL